MTDRLLEQFFPDIEAADSFQAYDAPEGAVIALEAIEAEFQPGDRPDTLAAKAQALVTELDATVCALITQLLPDEDVNADVAYTLDDASQLPVLHDALVARLRHGQTDEALRFRVADTTLETSIQAVLDSLTAQRINEELDAPTFVERLRGGFRRIRSGAASKKATFADLKTRAERVVSRLQMVERLAGFLRSDISERLREELADSDVFEDEAAALAEFARNSREFAERVLAFSVISVASLERIEKDICSDLNIAGAEGESVLVSREAENHVLFRAAPIIWAFCVTVLAKIILAHNTSETLHILAVPILILTYVLTWGFSIFIGIWTRKRRMRDLHKHIRQQFRKVLHDPSVKDELIEFPYVDPEKTQLEGGPITAYPYRGRIKFNTAQVLRRNLLALVLPLILLAMVLIARNGGDQRFMARFEGTSPCVLAQGRLVFATKNSFFVMPQGRIDGFWETALRGIFPELFADVVPREHIIRVKDVVGSYVISDVDAGASAADLRDCTTVDPDRNAYTLTHVGNTADFSSNVQNLENVTLGLNKLVAALTTGDPISIDVNAALGTTPSVTVELGETSLDVLAQATAFGGLMSPAERNPVIVDARNTIALELSKSDVAEVDLTVLFDALATIGEAIGGDASIEQILTLAFGGITLTSPDVVIPDSILALFEGEDTLSAELRALREASETSNSLVQTFITAFENETGRLDISAALTERFDVALETQQQLLAVLSTMSPGQPSETVVMAPIILDTSDTGPAGTTSANIFQTSITIDDESTELGTLGNSLVLPVFTDPVETGTGALNTLQGAFDWGRDKAKLRDPVVREDGTTYFDRIARTIESCLVGDAVVTIDVLGLASRSWSGATGGVSDAALNYHLAEGRRLGALLKIADGVGDVTALERILVVGSGGDVELSSILNRLAVPTPAADLVPVIGRFETVEAFETRRDRLLAVTGLSGENASPLEELFARSVVLRMVSTDGGPCAF